jgi:hypothetical protein
MRGKAVTRGLLRLAFCVTCLLCVLRGREFLSAQIQMPDPKQMSGIPRPVDDLPSGSISVRLIRGDLSNNITGYPVELHIGDKVQTVKTDDAGRAQFDHLNPGATLRAVAVVDGERLESQEFPMPSRGGVRLMLVATDKEKEAKASSAARAPAVTGDVVLGDQSRVIIEPGEETVSVYYLLTITNAARTPVNPSSPFVFDMPAGASGTTVLEGSSPQARADGSRVYVDGPFPPGDTSVQVACSIPVTSGTLEISQRFPAALQQLAVLAKKVGNLKLSSPQLLRQQEMPASGETAIVGEGGTIPAGQRFVLTLSGLPYHSPAPRASALLLALGIALVGVWASTRSEDPTARKSERQQLIARREKLFQELVRLENDRRNNRGDGSRHAGRRDELIAALEQVYGALDTDGVNPAETTDRPGLAQPLAPLGAS